MGLHYEFKFNQQPIWETIGVFLLIVQKEPEKAQTISQNELTQSKRRAMQGLFKTQTPK